ncbi:MAG: PEP-CTERM sorting domain-containing protein [Pseudomonadota bacterium]
MKKLMIAFGAALFASTAPASAATLLFERGELQGADYVDVGGALYNVRFLNGACSALFDGCNEFGDFAFNSQADAQAAAQALLDQVFVNSPLGAFDDQPELTFGCEFGRVCRALIPFEPVNNRVRVARSQNGDTPGRDRIRIRTIQNSFNSDNGANSRDVFAVFTAIPEPSTWLVLTLGLFGIGGLLRRKSALQRLTVFYA